MLEGVQPGPGLGRDDPAAAEFQFDAIDHRTAVDDRTGDLHRAVGRIFVRGGEDLLGGQVDDEGYASLGHELGCAPDVRAGQLEREIGPRADIADAAMKGGVEFVAPTSEGGEVDVPGGDGINCRSGFIPR